MDRIRDTLDGLVRKFPRRLPSSPVPVWIPKALSRDSLDRLALELAHKHQHNIGNLSSARVLRSYSANRSILRRIYLRLAEAAHNGENLTAGGEWLLDNYHVVERHAAQIKKYLPQGFYRTLPKILDGEMRGLPRIYHLALEFVMHTDASTDTTLSVSFIRSYQQVLELSSGELWAFPIMLRLALLENLRNLTVQAERELLAQRKILQLIEQVVGDESRTGTQIMVELARRIDERDSFLPHSALELLKRLRSRGRKAYMALQFLEEKLRERGIIPEELVRAEDHQQATRQISVGNTLTSLTTIDQCNWREWFESVSLVDDILRKDPAGLYRISDFTTRDTLRHHIEKIAKRISKADSFVAEAVLQCAQETKSANDTPADGGQPVSYVGYYLLSSGRITLENKLSYRPPVSEQIFRILRRHSLLVYLGAIATLSLFLTGYVFLLSEWADASYPLLMITIFATLLPISELASSLVQYLGSRWVLPQPLPKLDSTRPIPNDCRTLVVVHTIFGSAGTVQKAIDGLEVRFLANDDPALTFVLMADLPDADSERTSSDDLIISEAAAAIERLNQRHASSTPRFVLFFRSRQWNKAENKWMAWERKRGKLEELNRFILGDDSTSLLLMVGNREEVRKARYVITLDSDSQLSRDTAKKLIATIAHPMNAPVIDSKLNRVTRGYAFIQPRVTISLTSATNSRFSRLFSGQAGLDPYTNVVSEVYQDLFGEGSFWGKGIYDVQAFERVLRDRVPENSLLSHDLFEGSFARVALASDIELYDDFPSRYMAYSKRLHRWVRGDWQLLPWLFRRVPSKLGYQPTQISALSWWKMFDNLRRSLVPPACLFVLLGGWLFLPGGPLVWTTIVIINISFPVFTGLASVFALPSVGISLGGFLGDIGRDAWRNAARAGLAIAFLPHQAGLMLHAIGITLYRVYISKKHLLEWEPAERSERKSKNENKNYLKIFLPMMAIVILALVYSISVQPHALLYSLPLVSLWAVSPLLAKVVSRPLLVSRGESSDEDRSYLLTVAYDTWLFFREYLRPHYSFLMPDNLQLNPSSVVAERTSPTNISLSMLSVQSAYDLGFIPLNVAVTRVAEISHTLAELDKFRGHLYNWYSITTRKPLAPRYISTVDSGNLLGHLYTFLTILDQTPQQKILGEPHLEYLRSALARAVKGAGDSEKILHLQSNVQPSRSLLDLIAFLNSPACREFLEENAPAEHQSDALSEQSRSQHHHLHSLLTDLGDTAEIFEWVVPLQNYVGFLRTTNASTSKTDKFNSAALDLFNKVSTTYPSFRELKISIAHITGLTENAESLESEADRFKLLLLEALGKSLRYLEGLENAIKQTRQTLRVLIQEMDFSFLYDSDRDLFTIGYNAEHATKDKGYYDLLASEARLLSFLAVARGEVPQRHWFSLGRSLANTPGGKALISWSGTMFEYLMPFLVMRDYPTTILGRTARAVVSAQIAYSQRKSAPWGISESAYSGVDFEKTYQYRAFGVPGLGLKRGLSEDLVISPYSSLLALNFGPSTAVVIRNLKHIEREGGRGKWGFFEAIDYTHSRHARAERRHIVQSFFAHHQGMSLVSINNALNNDIMCERFHEQPIVKSTELLLHERFPQRVAAIVPHEPELSFVQPEEEQPERPGLEVIKNPLHLAPRVRLLSNGRYSVLIDSAGGGTSLYDKTHMVTRWREDSTCSNFGSFLYIHDVDTKKTWSTSYQPTRVQADSYEAIFSPGKAEFKRFDDDIFVHTEITVAPDDNLELRRVTVTNLSQAERELELVSYNEPSLSSFKADAAHPAFSKLFIEAEPLTDNDAILCTRKARTEQEQELCFFHRVTLKTSYAPIRFYTSRASFIGRKHSLQRPNIFEGAGSRVQPYDGNVDPIASLGCTVRLDAGASETLTFISGVSDNRSEALRLLSRYEELMHVNRAFELSWSRAQVELRSHAHTASQAELFHRLAGCLFYNEPTVRAEQEVLKGNSLTQSGLWRFGVSGDLPIVLVRVSDSKQIKHLQELLLGHHFLRERGLEFDLVVLHHNEGSYIQQLAEDIEYAVRLTPAGGLIDKPGGVFLRSSIQISESESLLLETVARVVLNCSLGGLAELLSEAPFEQTAPFSPTEQPTREQVAPLDSSNNLSLYNGIGGFDRATNHYLLNISDTSHPPLPWSNVISNPSFGALVTESGGGYTWSENSRENRITEWSNDPVLDPVSEVIYVRNVESGDFWSLTPNPSGSGLSYQVEHGFGFSKFSTNNRGIFSDLEVSVSPDRPVKWYSIDLLNRNESEIRLELFLYAEIVLGISRQDSYRFITTSFDRTNQVVNAVNRYNNEFSGRVCSVGSSAPIIGHTTSRTEFVGKHGDLSAPQILKEGINNSFISTRSKSVKLSGKTGAGGDPCVALQVSVAIPANEARTLHFFLSEHPSIETARNEIIGYKSRQALQASKEHVKENWNSVLGAIKIKTPDEAFDVLMNGWLLYQTVACRLYARSAFYQSGGALGFRDQLQDSLALLPIEPELTRQQILIHAAQQFTEGDVQHWWHPPTNRGVRTKISDDLLWLPYVVARYVETTGDYSLLSEQVPFITGPALAEGQMESYFTPEVSQECGTILEHCLRTFDATKALGPHNLPLIGAGDWNDGMNEVGKEGQGESVWLAWFQAEVIRRFTSILTTQGELDRVEELRQRATDLTEAAELAGWDGEWYRRAFYDDGTPMGSNTSDDCQIDSLCQSWAVMSQQAKPERARTALDAVMKNLVDREAGLIKLLDPPFHKTDKNPGYIKGYPPGVRENGGQYTHAATWVIIAQTMLGHGNIAFDLFNLINPINHTRTSDEIDTYQGEPYAMCGDVYSQPPLQGRAGWSWYTGSAGWLYQAGLHHILGIEFKPDGFSIDPCIPSAWKEFSLEYRHQNRTFVIQVSNPSGVETGMRSVNVEGIQIEGDIIPYEHPSYGTTVTVMAVMGTLVK